MNAIAPNNTGLALVSVRQSNLIRVVRRNYAGRVNLTFLVKLGKPAIESFRLLTEMYMEMMSLPRVFEWVQTIS